MDTWLLDQETWDICLDANGNWAIASAPYSLAQDVATAVRTVLGECWYDTTLGVPWLSNGDQNILGNPLNVTVFQELMVKAALEAVPATADVYVVSAKCVITSFNRTTRVVLGQIQFVDSTGGQGSVNL